MRRLRPHRNHRGYWAFLGHRLSGLALALFLPFHFLALATVLDEARFDALIAWTETPLLKVAEWGLVSLLALHLFLGVRLLMIELTDWQSTDPGRASWIVPSAVASVAIGTAFIIAGLF